MTAIKIALIGAGNVATHLGSKLAEANFPILQVFSRTEESARSLTDRLNKIYAKVACRSSKESATQTDLEVKSARPTEAPKDVAQTASQYTLKGLKGKNDGLKSVQKPELDNFNVFNSTWTNSIKEITPEADLYLVMLKDAVLDDFLPSLVKRNPNALFVHTAGSVPMNIWEGLTQRYGVLYPMQTFSKAREVDFEQVHFFVEANSEKDLCLLKEIAGHISSKVFEASSEQRKYLHLSAVFACNFTNHMYAICDKLLSQHGLPFSSMFPLIDETARKVHYMNPVDGQTGPAQRNDTNVMQRQEQLLQDDPKVAELYQLISEHIHTYEVYRQKEK